MTSHVVRSHRLQPLRAWRELRALVRNPEDTERVFHIMEALRGLVVTVDGRRVALRPAAGARMTRPRGQGGLLTTRVVLPLTFGFNVLLRRETRAFWPWYVAGNLHLAGGLEMLLDTIAGW